MADGHPDYELLSCHAPEGHTRRDAAPRLGSRRTRTSYVRSPLDIQLDNTCAAPGRGEEGGR